MQAMEGQRFQDGPLGDKEPPRTVARLVRLKEQRDAIQVQKILVGFGDPGEVSVFNHDFFDGALRAGWGVAGEVVERVGLEGERGGGGFWIAWPVDPDKPGGVQPNFCQDQPAHQEAQKTGSDMDLPDLERSPMGRCPGERFDADAFSEARLKFLELHLHSRAAGEGFADLSVGGFGADPKFGRNEQTEH